ncbi:hypothetical protein BDF19DRAFT_453581 [Syncephalis fuscata]|nr:hypothetical protein BDF19DRAFT_453581 [Syncephalis fuscata]
MASQVQASLLNNSMMANPAPVVETEKQENPNTLWLGGFHNDSVEESEIRQFFGPLSNSIVNVKLMFDRNTGRQRAFCFVEFDSAIAREQAMHYSGNTLKGHTIKLNPAVRSTPVAVNPTANQPTLVTSMEASNFNAAVAAAAVMKPSNGHHDQWGYGAQMTSATITYDGQGQPIQADTSAPPPAPTHVTLIEESMHQEVTWQDADKVVAQQMGWEEEAAAEMRRAADTQAVYAEAKAYMSLPPMGQATTSWADTPGCQEMVNPLEQYMDPSMSGYPSNNAVTTAVATTNTAATTTTTATATTATTAVEANGTTANRSEEVEQDNSRTLWIGNFFNETVSEDELRGFLGPCAQGVVHIKFMFDRKTGRQRPFCFVEFTSEAYLAEALELSGKKLKSADVKINRAGHKESSKRVDETGILAA